MEHHTFIETFHSGEAVRLTSLFTFYLYIFTFHSSPKRLVSLLLGQDSRRREQSVQSQWVIFVLRPTCLAALWNEAMVFSLILWCLENASEEVNGDEMLNVNAAPCLAAFVPHSLGCVWAPGSPVANVYRASLLPVLHEAGTHVTLQSLDGPDHQVVD